MPKTADEPAEEPKPKRLGGRPKKEPEDRLKSVTTHVSVERYEELQAGAAAVRRPMSQFVRPLVEAGVKARKRPVLQLTIAQDDYLRQLSGMANNLNQLSKRAHQSGFAAVAQQVEAQAATLHRLLDYFADVV
ncbi:MobC family plasmid mobilization relaxosome protein [Hymenobacter sp. H14-R3]|uniref:MobC family plasmid mobilization relaxosome protein n=1 Tax=Hymenobacter sp. H14-R3 TaxID=3046308 RepID=UPI0024B8B985|nr:MobC family plasmid mobilization relaxosome protein [Hymenobacter sp. H14-R3]MDJ0367987.1 MobC family plasmid mobilization relaxosome protein [Hymenobacter sp. H14-R3]